MTGARGACRGFSLLELLVVVVIIGLFAGAAVYSFTMSIVGNDPQVEQETQRLRSLIDLLREEGLMQSRDYGVLFTETGYRFYIYDYTTLISEQLIDYVRMPPGDGGGVTHLLKVAALAGIYHVQTGFHGATDLSPVSLAASLHLDTALNNFGIQEYMPHAPLVAEVFKTGYRYENGFMVVDDTPGIGVDIDEKMAERYPYSTACLPVNRKLDGTLHYW